MDTSGLGSTVISGLLIEARGRIERMQLAIERGDSDKARLESEAAASLLQIAGLLARIAELEQEGAATTAKAAEAGANALAQAELRSKTT